MPVKYTQDAVERCKELYLKYNGQNYKLIEQEMRLKYPRWTKSVLCSVKATKGRNAKLGWPDKYGWDKLLKQQLEIELEKGGLTHAARLHRSIVQKREQIDEKLKAFGVQDADRKSVV